MRVEHRKVGYIDPRTVFMFHVVGKKIACYRNRYTCNPSYHAVYLIPLFPQHLKLNYACISTPTVAYLLLIFFAVSALRALLSTTIDETVAQN